MCIFIDIEAHVTVNSVHHSIFKDLEVVIKENMVLPICVRWRAGVIPGDRPKNLVGYPGIGTVPQLDELPMIGSDEYV